MSILEGSYNRYLFQWPQKTANLRRNGVLMADLRRSSEEKRRPATFQGMTCDVPGHDLRHSGA